MKDVVIVGGGLAGLSAAWRLRHWDIQLLEADTGRSAGECSRNDAALRAELGWAHVRRRGQRDAAIGRRDRHPMGCGPRFAAGNGHERQAPVRGRVQSYPFRLPMSPAARFRL